MKCSLCGRDAVYNRRYTGTFLCDRCLAKSLERRFQRTIVENKLIAPGERIAVAVSGGKDSTTCMHLLAEHCERKNCELVAITIDEGISGYREHGLLAAKKNAGLLGIEHKVKSFKEELGATLDEIVCLAKERGTGFGACTYCGVFRRSLLNRAARELGADKIATAHNLDDEAQAIMLNYIRSDLARLYRLGAIYPAHDGFVPRIKPFREIPEKEVALYAMVKGVDVDLSECPHVGGIHLKIRDFINSLEENHPNSKFMILRTFDKIKANLVQAAPAFEEKRCGKCGEPTSASICKACELLDEIGVENVLEKSHLKEDSTT